MILDPLNSITSLNFYRKVAAQSVGRTALYLVYLAGLFSVAATVALKVKVAPAVAETFQWLETSVPPLTFSKGRLSSPQSGPMTLRHPQYPEIAFTLDTSRTEPVTLDMLDKEGVKAYITSNAFYFMAQPNKLETRDFSRGASPTAKPVTLDAAFYRQAYGVMMRVLYPVALAMTFLVFLAWKTATSFLFSALALAVNAIQQGSLAYGSLFSIAVYAQTLVIAVQVIVLFAPRGLPFGNLLSLAATGTYIWLGVARAKEPQPAP